MNSFQLTFYNVNHISIKNFASSSAHVLPWLIFPYVSCYDDSLVSLPVFFRQKSEKY